VSDGRFRRSLAPRFPCVISNVEDELRHCSLGQVTNRESVARTSSARRCAGLRSAVKGCRSDGIGSAPKPREYFRSSAHRSGADQAR